MSTPTSTISPIEAFDLGRWSAFRAWFVRWAPNVAVVTITAAVGGVAAVISYAHQHALNLAHEVEATAWTAKYWPVTVEGIVLAAGLVLVIRRRAGRPGGFIVWAAMLVGAAVTLAANVASARIDPGTGVPDRVAQLMNAWPPLAFLFAVELLVIAFRPWAAGPVQDRASRARTARPQRSRTPAVDRPLLARVRRALAALAWLGESPAAAQQDRTGDTRRTDDQHNDSDVDQSDTGLDRSGDEPTGPVRPGFDTNSSDDELSADLVEWAMDRGGPVSRTDVMAAYGIGRGRCDRLRNNLGWADKNGAGADRSRTGGVP